MSIETMKFIFLFIGFCCARLAFSQTANELEVMAKKCRFNGNTDSAIYFFERIRKEFPGHNPSYITVSMGEIYVQKKDISNARKKFLEVLKMDKGGHDCRTSCLNLAQFCINENDFKKALFYLDMAEKKFVYVYGSSAGEFMRKTRLACQYYQTYIGLKQDEKALKTLAPYMFYCPSNYGSSQEENLEYLSIVNTWLNRLRQHFTTDTLKAMWQQTFKTISFEANVDESNRTNMITFQGSLIFMGEKAELPPQVEIIENSGANENVSSYYNHDKLLQGLLVVPAYTALKSL